MKEQREDDKKPYTKPVLMSYGGIREITQAMDNTGLADGGMGSTDKT